MQTVNLNNLTIKKLKEMLKKHQGDSDRERAARQQIEWVIKRKKNPGVSLPIETAYFRKRIDLLAQLYRTNPGKFKEKMIKI